MAHSQSVDFYRFSRNMSDEERSVRDTVRRFVDQSFLPVVRKHFADGTFPAEIVPELGAIVGDRTTRDILGAAGVTDVFSSGARWSTWSL